jgi:hypothetical protein
MTNDDFLTYVDIPTSPKQNLLLVVLHKPLIRQSSFMLPQIEVKEVEQETLIQTTASIIDEIVDRVQLELLLCCVK